MEPFTLTAIATILSPFLIKAGEKVAEKIGEKTVETLFESRQELAEKFKGLFNDEIIALDLNKPLTPEEINKQLEAKPEVKEQIQQKVVANQDLMNKLTDALSKQEGRKISCKTYIETIEHIDTANFS